ncbi:type VI secretion system-associated FHA domain protein TagH [Azospirillum sp. RWY-5-1]|uniref:Type VI secretion system-associated FHA domain protein TagH n=1 Tax=Azospirillum oleiclasticum TaxID=2735135 RepID=A0ABX2T2Z1_9PROT|nr:type VI secretion system-associated FHA domain protein TagH [Azospirillum oleiclasticum]NYZ11043.1 type VI secretion system-associated FHA domain protein TagH [Azospirillum oleiclasticum]NYZ18205.1 type VI secretion system-associated FHA domain protein TagH [Azospirillum oleiclasticum]
MLILRLVSIEGRPQRPAEERRLTAGRMTLGRGSENSWVLDDPTRALSKQHCQIVDHDGGYEVLDTSTNGVYLNDGPAPLGRGHAAMLADGDTLRLGRYVFQVAVERADAALSQFDALFDDGHAATPDRPAPDPLWPAEPMQGRSFGDEFDLPEAPPPRGAGTEWGTQDWGGKGDGEDLLGGRKLPAWDERSYQIDRSASENDAFLLPEVGLDDLMPEPAVAPVAPTRPEPDPIPDEAPRPAPAPTAGGMIPDDWDFDTQDAGSAVATPEAVPVTAPVHAPIPADDDFLAPPEPPRQPAVAPPRAEAPPPRSEPQLPAAGADRLIQAFLEGVGAPALGDGRAMDEAAMREAGRILREALVGLQDILSARRKVKGEFGVERTAFGRQDNNPLKFTATTDGMLTRVLGPPEPGYMAGLAAVQEAVNDVRAHELAMLAGQQVALKSLIEKFDPGRLKGRLESSSFLDSLIPGARKARYWEVYEMMYGSIARDVEDDFQRAYSTAVSDAYEARLLELENEVKAARD